MPMRGHYNVNEIMVEKTISEINERIKMRLPFSPR